MEEVSLNCLKRRLEETRTAPRKAQVLVLLILLIGAHSISLGIYIYFFTALFYRTFFLASVDNLFFVRQSGLFLLCLGLFYLAPLFDLNKYHRTVLVMVATKVLAVFFLVTNAGVTPCRQLLLWTAAGDGCMALLLVFSYRSARVCLEGSETKI